MNMHTRAEVTAKSVEQKIQLMRQRGRSDGAIADELETEGYTVVRDGLNGHVGIKTGNTTTYY